MRLDGVLPAVISGTFSSIREDVSSPYHLTLEPATRRIEYLALSTSSSSVLSSVFVVTDFRITQNLKVPTVDFP